MSGGGGYESQLDPPPELQDHYGEQPELNVGALPPVHQLPLSSNSWGEATGHCLAIGKSCLASPHASLAE